MGKKNIDQFSFGYFLLKAFVARPALFIYYKYRKSHNVKIIPRGRPMIFAMNHENALIDALVVLCMTNLQPVFLARQDVFKGKVISAILTFLKILPIYRIRDGREQLSKNDEIFEMTLQILKNKFSPVGIMPEGSHGDKRRLRPFVKGTFRMAFRAQEEYGKEKGVVIVPIGVDYGHYSNFRSRYLINFGEPIEVADFVEQHTANQAIGINALRERLSKDISDLMIDIQSEDFYDLTQSLRTIYNFRICKQMGIRGKDQYERFLADKKMIAKLREMELQGERQMLTELDEKVRTYESELTQMKLRDWVLRRSGGSVFISILLTIAGIVTFPVFVAGTVCNFIPYSIPILYARKIKDTQFKSSFKYVMGMITFVVWYLIAVTTILVVSHFNWPGLLFAASLPFMGLYAVDYYINAKKLMSRWKFHFGKLVGNMKLEKLIKLRADIIQTLDGVFSNSSQ